MNLDAAFLVPVIDLLDGQVVHAVRGERARYRPIESRLAAGSDPVAIAAALLRHSGADRLYVADLDALQGGAPQAAVLARLCAALPAHVQFWVDAGFADRSAARALAGRLGDQAARVVPVFASEALPSRAAFDDCFDPASPVQALLSLDARGGRRLDAAGCWDATERWPERVIVMTLDRVGADAGPDLATLAELRRRSPRTRFVGAGGIRHRDDLRAARRAGAEAWLVASALHDGRLN